MAAAAPGYSYSDILIPLGKEWTSISQKSGKGLNCAAFNSMFRSVFPVCLWTHTACTAWLTSGTGPWSQVGIIRNL